MRSFSRWSLLCFIISPYLCFAREWSSYSSENFTVYSDVRPSQAEDLVREFEIFRELAFFAVGMQARPSHSRMKVLVYNNAGEYRDIGPKNSLGFFTNTAAGPRMVVGPSKDSIGRTQILYHEYIHYIMREHSDLIYPRWYDEGLAEVLGATTIMRDKATIGTFPEGRVQSINLERPMKIRELLEREPENDSHSYQSRFYAYAWLFTHYLQMSSLKENPHLKEQTGDFILRYNCGEEMLDAFEPSYGMTPEAMDKALAKYRSQRRFNVLTVDSLEYEGEIVRQQLSPGEQAFLLADIAWRVGKEAVALDYLDDIDLDQSEYARALSLAAVLENHLEEEDRIDVARNYANKALSVAPDDSQVLTNYAHWLADTRARLKKQGSDTGSLLADQINYSVQAINNDPGNLEAHSYLWQAQLEQGEAFEALKTMMAAYQLDPSSIRVNYTVAQHLLAMQRGDLAKPFLERVMNWSHSPEQRLEIQKILNNIDNSDTRDGRKCTIAMAPL